MFLKKIFIPKNMFQETFFGMNMFFKERLQGASGNDTSGNSLDQAKKCYHHLCAMATKFCMDVQNRLLSCDMKPF